MTISNKYNWQFVAWIWMGAAAVAILYDKEAMPLIAIALAHKAVGDIIDAIGGLKK